MSCPWGPDVSHPWAAIDYPLPMGRCLLSFVHGPCLFPLAHKNLIFLIHGQSIGAEVLCSWDHFSFLQNLRENIIPLMQLIVHYLWEIASHPWAIIVYPTIDYTWWLIHDILSLIQQFFTHFLSNCLSMISFLGYIPVIKSIIYQWQLLPIHDLQ